MATKPITETPAADTPPPADIAAQLQQFMDRVTRMGCLWLAIQSGDRQKGFNGVDAKALVDRAAILESFAVQGASGSVATAASDSTDGITHQA